MSTYSDKCQDPRWQKKRLEILSRDQWMCQRCFAKTSTLHVHHRRYIPNIEPWDYPDELLLTLCKDCHESETVNSVTICNSLIEVLQTKFLSEEISEIAIGFHGLNCFNMPEVLASVIGWALSDKTTMDLITDRYFADLRTRLHNRVLAKS